MRPLTTEDFDKLADWMNHLQLKVSLLSVIQVLLDEDDVDKVARVSLETQAESDDEGGASLHVYGISCYDKDNNELLDASSTYLEDLDFKFGDDLEGARRLMVRYLDYAGDYHKKTHLEDVVNATDLEIISMVANELADSMYDLLSQIEVDYSDRYRLNKINMNRTPPFEVFVKDL